MCFRTVYAPYEEPAPRVGNHTAHYRPVSRHSHTSYRRSGSVARLPPARRSHDYYYRSSASSLPVTERRYVEYHEPARQSWVVERQPSPMTVRREKVVYRG